MIGDDEWGMRDAYVAEEDESNEDNTTTSNNKSNEMSDNSVDKLIDDLNSLHEEVEQLIKKIEHMSTEEEKVDKRI